MKIEILDEAQEDLIQGFRFYESQEPGLGAYFLDCLFSDIDSLLVYAGFTQRPMLITAACPSVSHLRFTTVSKGSWFACKRYEIVVGIRLGSGTA